MFNAIFFFLLCRFIFIVIHLFHFVNLFHRRKPLRGKHVESNENLDHVVNKKIEEFVVTASRFLKDGAEYRFRATEMRRSIPR